MYQPEERLFDRVLELHEQWSEYAAAYRRHAVRLLDRGWPFGSDAASADLGALSELVIHAAQLFTMDAIVADLQAVLNASEDAAIDQGGMRPQPPSGSASADA
jgi:hypothetical protein